MSAHFFGDDIVYRRIENEDNECSMESDDSILNDYVLRSHSPGT